MSRANGRRNRPAGDPGGHTSYRGDGKEATTSAAQWVGGSARIDARGLEGHELQRVLQTVIGQPAWTIVTIIVAARSHPDPIALFDVADRGRHLRRVLFEAPDAHTRQAWATALRDAIAAVSEAPDEHRRRTEFRRDGGGR